MNLDIDSWKEFYLEDIFELRGGFYNKKPEHSIEGDIPFLASTENNNGVTEFYSTEDIKQWDKVGGEDWTLNKKIYDGNCIAVTVNGSVCNAFYQAERFTCSHDITALYLRYHNMNPYIAQFLCTVIMQDKYRWSYGRKPHDVKKFGRSLIKLPVNLFGDLDWQFMEDYIRSLHHKPLTTKNKPGQVPDLNVYEWGEFRIGDLFKIKRGDRIVHGEDYFDIQDDEYKYPVITTTTANNGTDGFYNQTNCSGNCIVSGGEASGMFTTYQEGPFWGLDTIRIYEPIGFKMNKYIGLFLATELTYNMYRFSYGRKAKPDNMYTLDIRLPILSDGGPDWQFMENYIKALPYGDRLTV